MNAPAPRLPRIGLLGGSFDPVHCAHLALARLALARLELDELRWLPVGHAWQKARVLTAAVHRCAMVGLAIADEPRFVIDRREVERDGPTYTIDTLRELQDRTEADWFLVIGQDQYGALDSWRDWQAVVRRVTLAVAGRAGSVPSPAPALAALPHRVVELPLPPMPLSSTEIRARAARGEPLDGLVPPAVARYIAQHHLYTS
ncbi:nicotinate-nucleotide adenylyltransferase [Caldimonas tepidiphila]|uniref:nicotinate-nucleotide adenylyltransferase n=1 Tax=Caldimonas tepidiphila TaxID=2315841 RepID=UPI000E5B82C3|nr:nicotinate-nucleotide adenylyltransferase [Caldimonas tepidiphila]